jgi:hypothetical protein
MSDLNTTDGSIEARLNVCGVVLQAHLDGGSRQRHEHNANDAKPGEAKEPELGECRAHAVVFVDERYQIVSLSCQELDADIFAEGCKKSITNA